MSAGTSMEQAQENVLLCQTILSSSELNYGVYKPWCRNPGSKKGKTFIGNKLSHMRKPSSYKGKNRRVCIITLIYRAVAKHLGRGLQVSHLLTKGMVSGGDYFTSGLCRKYMQSIKFFINFNLPYSLN